MKSSSWIALIALVLVQMSGRLELPDLDLRGLLSNLVPTSPAAPVDAPAESLQQLTRPLADKLAGDNAKATKVASAFAGYGDAINSPIGQLISSTGQWGQIVSAATARLDVAGGVSVGAELREIVKSHVGISADPDDPTRDVDRPLTDEDRRRTIEVYRAISWAAAGGGT